MSVEGIGALGVEKCLEEEFGVIGGRKMLRGKIRGARERKNAWGKYLGH